MYDLSNVKLVDSFYQIGLSGPVNGAVTALFGGILFDQ